MRVKQNKKARLLSSFLRRGKRKVVFSCIDTFLRELLISY